MTIVTYMYVLTPQKLVSLMTSEDAAHNVYMSIKDDQTYNDPEHYGAQFSNNEVGGTSHTAILAPNGDAVAITSTINLRLASTASDQEQCVYSTVEKIIA